MRRAANCYTTRFFTRQLHLHAWSDWFKSVLSEASYRDSSAVGGSTYVPSRAIKFRCDWLAPHSVDCVQDSAAAEEDEEEDDQRRRLLEMTVGARFPLPFSSPSKPLTIYCPTPLLSYPFLLPMSLLVPLEYLGTSVSSRQRPRAAIRSWYIFKLKSAHLLSLA